MSHEWSSDELQPTPAQDVTQLGNPKKRLCVVHQGACPLPKRLFALGAGFSCTSFSGLNANSKSNVAAMKETDTSPAETAFFKCLLFTVHCNSLKVAVTTCCT